MDFQAPPADVEAPADIIQADLAIQIIADFDHKASGRSSLPASTRHRVFRDSEAFCMSGKGKERRTPVRWVRWLPSAPGYFDGGIGALMPGRPIDSSSLFLTAAQWLKEGLPPAAQKP